MCALQSDAALIIDAVRAVYEAIQSTNIHHHYRADGQMRHNCRLENPLPLPYGPAMIRNLNEVYKRTNVLLFGKQLKDSSVMAYIHKRPVATEWLQTICFVYFFMCREKL